MNDRRDRFVSTFKYTQGEGATSPTRSSHIGNIKKMNAMPRNFIGLFKSQNMVSLKFCQRSFQLECATFAVNKSSLATLRKDTGFSLSNCKNALELHDGDIDQSKAWLKKEAQKQGWAKATKLSGRVTTQGLIGFHIENRVGTLVEVNCETDFVARNQEFQDLVSNIAKEFNLANESNKKEVISKEDIGKIKIKGDISLSDTVALAIGKIGENMQITRGATLCVHDPDIQLIGYTHPSSSTNPSKVGKYGTIVAFKNLQENVSLARDLCAHIIGRNPSEIGSFEDMLDAKDETVTPDKPNLKDNVEKLPDALPTEAEEDFIEEISHNAEDEHILLKQKFVSDDDLTVGQVLKESGIEIIDFIRFQVGELEENT